MPLELAARRPMFPALAAGIAYLDSAATSLMPRAVLDAMTACAVTAPGNPGRGVHGFAEAATVALEDARAEVARAIGASAGEIVFTSGATGALNLVAHAHGAALVPGDVVVVTELEHHSNYLPWQQVCAARGAELVVAPADDAGRLDPAAIARALGRRVKLVACAHVSNVTGAIAPIAELASLAHGVGAKLVVDGAQAIAHLPVDVAALGCDFYAFSGHKVYGPPGIGVLWGRAALLAALPPWQTGGGMALATLPAPRFRPPPHRFEAGTPNTLGAVGLAAALRWLAAADRAAIARDEARAHRGLVTAIREAGGTLLGEPALAVAAFQLPRIHPHDLASIAAAAGVALRSGHHCAAPIHHRVGASASVRASVGCYTDDSDVARFAAALARAREVFP